MKKLLRAGALALVLAATPACASLRPDIANPIGAARTIDEQAYALIASYAAVLEAAAKFIADPAAPLAVKQGLARAEALATPSVQALEIAVIAYLRAQADWRAAANDPSAGGGADAALAATAADLARAIADAQAPVHALQDALHQ